jgi:glycosyltransferase involved in cell wall biosynthesis
VDVQRAFRWHSRKESGYDGIGAQHRHMRVCVGTIGHHPEDARIMHRQIQALLDAGHEITYMAPFTDCNVTPLPPLTAIDVPRAAGRHRRKALRLTRGALARAARDADLLLVHDLELMLALPPRRRRPPVVWDVREDRAAELAATGLGTAVTRDLLRRLIERLEAGAERRAHLILSDEGHQDRFSRPHPIVPDATYVPLAPPPPSGRARVVHIGRLSADRGAAELIETARRLHRHGIRMDLIGPADPAVRPLVRDAQREGLLDWYGHVPSRHALRMAEGALAGLSLQHDLPVHRRRLPTKIMDYMGRGIPVITTPLPRPASVVGRLDCGTIVPFADVDAVVQAVLRLRDDDDRRAAMGGRGYVEARHHYHWPEFADKFVALVEEWAGHPAASRPPPLLV